MQVDLIIQVIKNKSDIVPTRIGHNFYQILKLAHNFTIKCVNLKRSIDIITQIKGL